MPDLTLRIAPTIGWGYESGASTGEALIYGAIVSATKVFSPSLLLGVGAGVVRPIDGTEVSPFLIVNWQIDEHWRIANSFRAGPAGGAGVELAYTVDDLWELAADYKTAPAGGITLAHRHGSALERSCSACPPSWLSRASFRICGCAIRYDHAGVTRVGIGLWGF